MSAFIMTANTTPEYERALTVLQMVFGCIFQKCGDIVEIYAFSVGDEGVIRETLEDVGGKYCGPVAIIA